MRKTSIAIAAVSGGLLAGPARGADDPLGDYLADLGPGPVAAHEVLGLPAGAVTLLQTPKDIVAALDKASGDGAKEGFGIAVAPGRLGDTPLSVGIARYTDDRLARLWGGTSFSYARRTKAFDAVDYKLDAFAVHVDYYLDAQDDPVVAARQAFVTCKARIEQESAFSAEVLRRLEAERSERGALVEADFERLKDQIRRDVLHDTFRAAATAGATCLRNGYARAKAKWNASQVGLTVGKGWIRGPAGGLRRSVLAQHVAATVAWKPPRMDSSLLNLTLRHVSKDIDTSTLAGTPVWHRSSIAGARYTYGHGPDAKTYLLAEVSNAKSSRQTEANAAFKAALGLDRKLGDGIWLELRVGRSRVVDGNGLETKALMNLKLSPTPMIPALVGG